MGKREKGKEKEAKRIMEAILLVARI